MINTKKRIADLFCGVGGASVGLHRAGYEVVGFDIRPQPNYPKTLEFHQSDAFDVDLSSFDAVWASPPCQGYSGHTGDEANKTPKYIDAMRERLTDNGKPFIIENVIGARDYMQNPVMLCGCMFDLEIRRRRLFESGVNLVAPEHDHKPIVYTEADRRLYSVTGHSRHKGTTAIWQRMMGMPWAKRAKELTEAIPPNYSEYLGKQLIQYD